MICAKCGARLDPTTAYAHRCPEQIAIRTREDQLNPTEQSIVEGLAKDEHVWCDSRRNELRTTEYEENWQVFGRSAGHAIFHIYNGGDVPYGGFAMKEGESLNFELIRRHEEGIAVYEDGSLVCKLPGRAFNIYVQDDKTAYGRISGAIMCGCSVELVIEYRDGHVRFRIARAAGSVAVEMAD